MTWIAATVLIRHSSFIRSSVPTGEDKTTRPQYHRAPPPAPQPCHRKITTTAKPPEDAATISENRSPELEHLNYIVNACQAELEAIGKKKKPVKAWLKNPQFYKVRKCALRVSIIFLVISMATETRIMKMRAGNSCGGHAQ